MESHSFAYTFLTRWAIYGMYLGGFWLVWKMLGGRTTRSKGAGKTMGSSLVKLFLIFCVVGGVFMSLFLYGSARTSVEPRFAADTDMISLNTPNAVILEQHAKAVGAAEEDAWTAFLHREFFSQVDSPQGSYGAWSGMIRDVIHLILALSFVTLWQAWSRNTP